jgi:hypothetical protein
MTNEELLKRCREWFNAYMHDRESHDEAAVLLAAIDAVEPSSPPVVRDVADAFECEFKIRVASDLKSKVEAFLHDLESAVDAAFSRHDVMVMTRPKISSKPIASPASQLNPNPPLSTEPPYRVRSFWSIDRRLIITACVSDENISLLDDNGDIYEATGPEQDMTQPVPNQDAAVKTTGPECRCGCYSGGCARPEGCKCDKNCPCGSYGRAEYIIGTS